MMQPADTRLHLTCRNLLQVNSIAANSVHPLPTAQVTHPALNFTPWRRDIALQTRQCTSRVIPLLRRTTPPFLHPIHRYELHRVHSNSAV